MKCREKGCPPPGTVRLDLRAKCSTCGRWVLVTKRGSYRAHKKLR